MKNCSKLSFSEKVRWRIRGLWLLLVLMFVYMIVIGECGLGDSRIMSPLANDVSRLIFFGGMMWVVGKIIRNRSLLNNRGKLKQKMLEETDERNRWLHEKSGGIVWDIMFFCLLFTTLTTSLINMPAFYTSFALLFMGLLVKCVCWLVYR